MKLLPNHYEQKFGFKFLKSCDKRLTFKCLHGSRVYTAKKIHPTLKEEKKQVGEDLSNLAKEFVRNCLLQEFDCLN